MEKTKMLHAKGEKRRKRLTPLPSYFRMSVACPMWHTLPLPSALEIEIKGVTLLSLLAVLEVHASSFFLLKNDKKWVKPT